MSSPLVSIGLPVYNGARFLRQALDSLLAQDYTDFELIISDNASTDATPQICADYAARDPRFRYFRAEENRGAVWNHRRVVELARGPFFKWAAHDDECAPSLLRRCVQTLAAAPDSVVLVYPQAEIIDEHGRVIVHYRTSIECRDARPHRRLGRVVAAVELGTPMYGVARTSVLRRTRLIDVFASSDFVFLAEMALLGEIWELPEPLLRKRFHPGRATEAHNTPEAMASWLDPRQPSRPGWRLPAADRIDLEYLRSVWRSPLGWGEKLRCAGAVLRHSRTQHYRWQRWKRRLLPFGARRRDEPAVTAAAR
jgi:glycosyltransferase involved in cell wall biosynthesis